MSEPTRSLDADPPQMRDLARVDPSTTARLGIRLSELLREAHDDFRSGHGYGEWFDAARNVRKTGLGSI